MNAVLSVPISAIVVNDWNPPWRVEKDDLVESLKQIGLLQPLGVTRKGAAPGKYRLGDGFRRRRAALELGWDNIDVICHDELSPQEIFAAQFTTRKPVGAEILFVFAYQPSVLKGTVKGRHLGEWKAILGQKFMERMADAQLSDKGFTEVRRILCLLANPNSEGRMTGKPVTGFPARDVRRVAEWAIFGGTNPPNHMRVHRFLQRRDLTWPAKAKRIEKAIEKGIELDYMA